MLETLQDAKAALEAVELHVAVNNPSSLLIGGSITDAGEGIQLFNDACALSCKDGQWIASFPAEGLCLYELPGSLPELVSVISKVYAQYRQTGGEFKDAFREVVSDSDQYLVGRTPARVRTAG